MSLLDLPIPPRPDYFGPDGAPPGVAVDLEILHSFDGSGRAWWETRPRIDPRVAIVHTNGASVEASLQSSIGHANRGANNTHPHYIVGAPQPTKVVPTDRRSIANSTTREIEQRYGETDASFWTLSIETADAGYIAMDSGVDLGDFLYDHDEIVARILAYEAIVHGYPLTIPDEWNGTGVVTHTEPFPYPYYTIRRGKTCPGTTKKDRVLRGDILPRAQQIHDAWIAPPTPDPPPIPEPPEENPMDTKQRTFRYVYVPTPDLVASGADKVFGVKQDGTLRHLGGPDLDVARLEETPEIAIKNRAHHDQYAAECSPST